MCSLVLFVLSLTTVWSSLGGTDSILAADYAQLLVNHRVLLLGSILMLAFSDAQKPTEIKVPLNEYTY